MAALPADHVDVACTRYNMGTMEFSRDDLDRAKTHLQVYLSIATKKKSGDSVLDPIPAITLILLIENEDKEDRISLELIRALNML